MGKLTLCFLTVAFFSFVTSQDLSHLPLDLQTICEAKIMTYDKREGENCQAGAFHSMCGLKYCFQVTGEPCNNYKYEGGKCHHMAQCTGEVCRGTVYHEGKIWIDHGKYQSSNMPNMPKSSIKRSQYPRFPSFDYVDESFDSENSIDDRHFM